MEEYLVFTLIETALFFYFWPKWMSKHRGYNNEALLHDNPHLRVCYLAKKWITPLTFLFLGATSVLISRRFQDDIVDIFFLNILVLVSAVVVGTMLSIAVVDHYKTGNYNKLT